MWCSQGDWGWGAWLVMTLSMIVFWAVVIWAVVTVARGAEERGPRRERRPEDILRERLARGDIDEDEYRRRLDTLRDARPTGTTGGGGGP